ncbi:hypothetical protein [Jeongeupia sp. USM3]|uniref:hypothetical protein n=1 Tax=Jeongeupia sp. USM3 TaxID=1906741 RepID=UPI0011AB3F3E|nr:hypothetical protein [Jeongeupia sp. USM3]
MQSEKNMPLTWVEVADTAIKIGLGTLITAVSGYLVLRKTQQAEVLKERKNRFYKLQENKAEIYVNFLSQSHSLVQAYLLSSCTCNTDEYKSYLKTFSELQIKSPNEIRSSAHSLLGAVNEFISINKNGIEVELSKRLRSAVNEKAGQFQCAAQLELAKEFSA